MLTFILINLSSKIGWNNSSRAFRRCVGLTISERYVGLLIQLALLLSLGLIDIAHRRTIASPWCFITLSLKDVYLNYMNWFLVLVLVKGLLVTLLTLHIFCVIITRCYKDVYINIFFPHTANSWHCFSLTYDLNCFKSKTSWNFSFLRSF